MLAVQEALQLRRGGVLLRLRRQRRRLVGFGFTGRAGGPRGAGLRDAVHRLGAVHVLLRPEGGRVRGNGAGGTPYVSEAGNQCVELQHAEQRTVTGWKKNKKKNVLSGHVTVLKIIGAAGGDEIILNACCQTDLIFFLQLK